MDESALKILIESLDNCRSSLDSWLSFFTSLVTVGVVLEVIFVVWEYRDDLHDWRRGFVHPPEKPSTILLLFGLFGASLVAIGVAGEWFIGAKIGAVETRIRKANDDRAILLSREAGEAKQAASDARTDADQAKRDLEQVEERVVLLNGQLDVVDRKAKLAQSRDTLLLSDPKIRADFKKALKPFSGQSVEVREAWDWQHSDAASPDVGVWRPTYYSFCLSRDGMPPPILRCVHSNTQAASLCTPTLKPPSQLKKLLAL